MLKYKKVRLKITRWRPLPNCRSKCLSIINAWQKWKRVAYSVKSLKWCEHYVANDRASQNRKSFPATRNGGSPPIITTSKNYARAIKLKPAFKSAQFSAKFATKQFLATVALFSTNNQCSIATKYASIIRRSLPNSNLELANGPIKKLNWNF